MFRWLYYVFDLLMFTPETDAKKISNDDASDRASERMNEHTHIVSFLPSWPQNNELYIVNE